MSLQNALAAVNLLVLIAGGIATVMLLRREQKLIGDRVQENTVAIEHLADQFNGMERRVQWFENREEYEREQRSRLGLNVSRPKRSGR